jgi:hypothetical protein
MNNKIRKFTHYALMTWAITLGAFAVLGKVYRYNIEGKIYEDFEDFIIEAGHSLSNVDWMTTNNGKLHTYMDN